MTKEEEFVQLWTAWYTENMISAVRLVWPQMIEAIKESRRVLGIDLAIQAPNVAVVADEEGKIVSEAIRFELSIEELERVERWALRGMPEGTKLHVVMEKTFPAT